MSNSSPLSNDSIAPPAPEQSTYTSFKHRLSNAIRGPLQFVSFWIAIVLPFVYLPILANGLGDPVTTATFLTLLGMNAVALYIGHDYNQ